MALLHELPQNLQDTCDGLFYCVSKWAYDVTGGLFWVIMLLAFQGVLILSTYRYGTTKAFGFAAVSGMLLAYFMATLNFMAWWIASGFIIIGFVGIATLIMQER